VARVLEAAVAPWVEVAVVRFAAEVAAAFSAVVMHRLAQAAVLRLDAFPLQAT
jgi:hypothetical protein